MATKLIAALRYVFIISFLMLFQNRVTAQVFEQGGILADPFYAGGPIRTIEMKTTTAVEGSQYFSDIWMEANISVKDVGVIKDVPIKYDLMSSNLVLKTDNFAKVLPWEIVKEFIVTDPNTGDKNAFVNAKNLTEDYIGFFEVIINGEYSLLKKYEISLQESNYNPIFDAGNENDRFLKDEAYYIHNNATVYEISRKKDLKKISPDEYEKIKEYIDINKIKFKEQIDYERVVRYLNESS